MRRPGTLPELTLPRERFELSSGALLLVSPRPSAPVTAVRVHVRGGPSLDPARHEGVAFLTGHLADQGTDRHSETELAALLEPAGGGIRGDASGLGGTIAGGEWKLLLTTMVELLRGATYPEEELERQRQRLLSRLHVERDEPRAQGGLRFKRLAYGDCWLGRSPWGTIESVQAIGRNHLLKHRRRHWRPDRATIAVCGDVDPQAVRRHLERAMAGWEPGSPFEPLEPDLPPRAKRVDAFTRDREQVHLFLGHLGIRRSDPDYAALTVLDHVLGTGPGFTNRISRRLRDELGLAYAVQADIHSSAGRLPGLFTAYIATSPEHVPVATEGFLEEMRRIRDEPVAEEELEVARNFLLGSFALGFERAARRAAYLVAAEVFGLPEDTLERLPREFASVGVEDLQRVAREHLYPEACCLSGAGPVTAKELRRVLG